MQILIISDIHANLTALEVVLAEAGNVDATWCLGDLVGYGPDPNECVNRIRNLPNLTCIIGNHDAAAIKQIDITSFNPEARNAIQWTSMQLSRSSHDFLSNLPERMVIGEVTLAHGSPRHPVWEYLLDTRTAALSFEYFDTPFCFVGHTHLPVIYQLEEGVARLTIPDPGQAFTLAERSIVNPGSVGQPRDRDPRAAYAIFNPENYVWEFRRVNYDISAVQKRMESFRLPDRHIQRLASGW